MRQDSVAAAEAELVAAEADGEAEAWARGEVNPRAAHPGSRGNLHSTMSQLVHSQVSAAGAGPTGERDADEGLARDAGR